MAKSLVVDEVRIAQKLAKVTHLSLTAKDYLDWLGEDGAGPGYSKFDRAVKKFLGRTRYQTGENLARLDALLRFKLGLGPKVAGGINLSAI